MSDTKTYHSYTLPTFSQFMVHNIQEKTVSTDLGMNSSSVAQPIRSPFNQAELVTKCVYRGPLLSTGLAYTAAHSMESFGNQKPNNFVHACLNLEYRQTQAGLYLRHRGQR